MVNSLINGVGFETGPEQTKIQKIKSRWFPVKITLQQISLYGQVGKAPH